MDLNHATRDMDFGRGFYTTKDINQANDWILRKFKGNGEMIEFRIPKSEFNKLNGLNFENADSKWLKFVTASRNGNKNAYDYVSGPMLANPRGYLQQGKKALSTGQQISFNTNDAINILNQYMKR